MVYHIPSTFDKAAGRSSTRKSASFGTSDRFNSTGSYLKMNNSATGPGHYSSGNFSRPSSRYGTIGPSSPNKDSRLQFRQTEGADAAYQVRSSFDLSQVISCSMIFQQSYYAYQRRVIDDCRTAHPIEKATSAHLKGSRKHHAPLILKVYTPTRQGQVRCFRHVFS
jgi:hypothetical protein